MNTKFKSLLSFTALFVTTGLMTSPAQADLDSTTGYTLTLGGFYYQPQLDNTRQYVGNFNVPSDLNTKTNNSLKFGFTTSILYQITNTPYNVLAGYKHFDALDDVQTNTTTVINRLQTDTTLNEVDVNVGRNFIPNQNFNFRLAAGARYADIDYKTNFIINPVGAGNPLENGSARAEYSGIGPNISLDADYIASCGFGVAAHANAAALIGNRNLTQSDAVLTDAAHNYTIRAARNVVGNFSGGLGLTYAYTTENYKLNGELGYAADYCTDPLITSNTTSGQTSTSILFQGPYFKFNLGF